MLDHFFEIGDAQGVEIVFGSEVLAGLAPFFVNAEDLARKKNGRGSKLNLQRRGKKRDTGSGLRGQLIRVAVRPYRSGNLSRRKGRVIRLRWVG